MVFVSYVLNYVNKCKYEKYNGLVPLLWVYFLFLAVQNMGVQNKIGIG